MWASAENPGRNLWLEAQGVIPLKQEIKPQVTLLSRKPVIAKRDPTSTLDEGDDSEEERRKKREGDFEERQRTAKIEREEKQRKYAEARQRIMGSSSSGALPTPMSREGSQGRDSRKPRGRNNGSKRSQPESPAAQSPIRAIGLFDPNDPARRLPKSDTNAVLMDDQPTRQPKGPDNSGRGGFGFASRGGKPV